MTEQEAYEAWRLTTIDFASARVKYQAGDKKAGVLARKLATAAANQLKAWRAASIEHDKGAAAAAQPEAPVEEQIEEQQQDASSLVF